MFVYTISFYMTCFLQIVQFSKRSYQKPEEEPPQMSAVSVLTLRSKTRRTQFDFLCYYIFILSTSTKYSIVGD
jgi:hypothetical protein